MKRTKCDAHKGASKQGTEDKTKKRPETTNTWQSLQNGFVSIVLNNFDVRETGPWNNKKWSCIIGRRGFLIVRLDIGYFW